MATSAPRFDRNLQNHSPILPAPPTTRAVFPVRGFSTPASWMRTESDIRSLAILFASLAPTPSSFAFLANWVMTAFSLERSLIFRPSLAFVSPISRETSALLAMSSRISESIFSISDLRVPISFEVRRIPPEASGRVSRLQLNSQRLGLLGERCTGRAAP